MTGADMLAAWHDHLALGLRRSPHTVRAYGTAAQRLLTRMDLATWDEVARLPATRLRTHLASRRADGLSNASAARELSALKGFIAFARAQAGHAVSEPPRLRGPRIAKGLPRPVTPDDAVGLADTVAELASDDWIGARDRAVLLLLYGAGLRIAEALSLTGADLPLGERLTVTGKGGKQRVVPLLPIIR
ncbi:MAG TPA: recombinase XerC, partial [Erythrobacter sp.]|nr:recombinase XerC [Erythrobacter sp.]